MRITRTSSCAGCVGALVVAALLSSVGTARAGETITVQVSTVLASNGSKGRVFDPQLDRYKSMLRAMRFKNYQLVKDHHRDVRTGDRYGVELPGGRYLHITALDSSPEHLKLRVLINENNRPIVNTDVVINREGVILLGGPKDEKGTLILAIRATPPSRSGSAARIDPEQVPQAVDRVAGPAQAVRATAPTPAPGQTGPDATEPATTKPDVDIR
ncbi:MAG: hypothetical protein ACE5E4_00280 [Candidatus Binatia bacterium]